MPPGAGTESRVVLAQLATQQGADRAGVFQSAEGDLADGFEVEAVLEAGLPVAVELAGLAALGELRHPLALPRELDDLEDDADGAEVVEVHRVGQQPGLVEHRGAVGHLVEQSDGAVEQQLVDLAAGNAQEQLGGFFGALAEGAALLLAGGEGAAAVLGELQREARQLQGFEVEALAADEVHLDEAFDAAPEAGGVVEEAR